MTKRRLFTLVGIGALLQVPACSSALGTTMPFCPSPGFQEVTAAIILAAQAVPSARFGPCLDRLEPGWTAHDLQAESGRAWFWLDSDRVGDRFLTVTLQQDCNTSGAEPGDSGVEGISLHTRSQAATPTRLGGTENAETLRGEWYLTFPGGCITYEFDAQGPGAMVITDEVRDALSFVPLEELREAARRAGFNI